VVSGLFYRKKEFWKNLINLLTTKPNVKRLQSPDTHSSGKLTFREDEAECPQNVSVMQRLDVNWFGVYLSHIGGSAVDTHRN
jgi:hypothetical protein